MPNKCTYFKGERDSYQQTWETACGKLVHCETPIEVGFSFPALPTDFGRKYCTYCGGQILLADKPLEMNTYEDWQRKGFHVMRGQKSSHRNDAGVAVFTIHQVAKTQPRFDPGDYDSDDFEPDWQFLDKD